MCVGIGGDVASQGSLDSRYFTRLEELAEQRAGLSLSSPAALTLSTAAADWQIALSYGPLIKSVCDPAKLQEKTKERPRRSRTARSTNR